MHWTIRKRSHSPDCRHPGRELGDFVELAFEKGFGPLVEVHNRAELTLALDAAARVIGINNRNFETLKTDLSTTEELAPLVREHDLDHGTRHIIISESGMSSTEDVRRVINAGADAVLIGSALMESDSVFEKTEEFVQSFSWRNNCFYGLFGAFGLRVKVEKSAPLKHNFV